MDKVINWLSVVVALAFSAWQNLQAVYQVLLVFMVLDMASGIIRAYVQKELRAQVAYIGIFKKGGEIVIVLMAAYLQALVPGLYNVPLPEALAGFYVYYEGLSVLENAVALGVPVPQFLRDALAKLSPDKNIPNIPEGASER